MRLKAMPRDDNSQDIGSNNYSRRTMIKTAGVSLAGVGLAGCSGNENESTPGGQTQNNNQNSPGGDEQTTHASSSNFPDVDLDYWNTINVQTPQSRAISEAFVTSFEKDTGATVNTNWTGYSGVIGAKWKNLFSQGNYPVMYDSASRWDGQLMEWIKPFSDYEDQFSDDFLKGIEYLREPLKAQWGGSSFGENVIYEVPFGLSTLPKMIARMDHFEKAGLSRDRFPPKDYDDLIDIASTLQKKGPGQVGFQIHGAKFDAFDMFAPGLVAELGGEAATLLNKDWSQSNWGTDGYKEQIKKWVEIHTKHGVSGPGTANHDDEANVQEIVSGRVSMAPASALNHPNYLESAGDMMKNGTIKWGEMWTGGFLALKTFGITKPPKGADETEWKKKQQAAIELIKYFTSKDTQKRLFQNFGLLPVRQDVWEDLPTGQPHNLYTSGLNQAKNSDLMWEAHPASVSLQYNIPGPQLQKALRGEISPTQACESIASTIRDRNLLDQESGA